MDLKSKKNLLSIILLFVAGVAITQKSTGLGRLSQIEITVINEPGYRIPSDFTGLSFETDATAPNHRNVKGYLFTASNKQLITLFRNTAIRNLRIGGSTVDRFHETAYDRAAIDSVFAFAEAAGVKVIYSLPLLNADPEPGAKTARYIRDNYGDLLDCFSIGNEPNCPPYQEDPTGPIRSYEEYFPIWQRFYEAVIREVPEAMFTGPDSGGWQFTEEFARDTKETGKVLFITHHQYPNGQPYLNNDKNRRIPADTAIARMLSPKLPAGQYARLHSLTGVKVHPYGFRCRMTESNDYLGGIDGASNAMSSALWALDYMHWQAFRGLAGINFHNNQWLKTCTINMNVSGEYFANPKAHAIRAFDMVAGGWTMPVDISNPDRANLTAYAVKGDDCLYVTIINKEYGQQARRADVTILVKGPAKGKAGAMYLTAPGNNAGAVTGITLGGDSITSHRPWKGKWTGVKKKSDGRYQVKVAGGSAVVVKIHGSQIIKQ
ncbi:MAG: glycosyl hydrolase family 79 C-terminal domain-containing protein [Bacteroidales bacterium]|jgi:hypothetical protein|nr:glycosyl hydrolase family 79 C-terminal domain-containing protein [Bacteroidales bacterium]